MPDGWWKRHDRRYPAQSPPSLYPRMIKVHRTFFPIRTSGHSGAPPRPGGATGCAFEPRCCRSDNRCRRSRASLSHVGVERQVACHKGGIETVPAGRGPDQDPPQRRTHHPGPGRRERVRAAGGGRRPGGPFGLGESTLAHILVRVLAADAGEIRFLGRTTVNRDATAVMGGIQIVFQDPGEAVSHRFRRKPSGSLWISWAGRTAPGGC